MTRKAFGDIGQMLHDLLDRHEAKPLATRLLAYVDEDAFSSVEARDRFASALSAVEATGGIRLQCRRLDGNMVLSHVQLGDPAALYAHLARMPARQRVDEALAEARSRTDLPDTAAAVLAELAEAWERGVSRFGLVSQDRAGLSAAIDLAVALHARARDMIDAPTDYRTFSRAAGTESKALERLAPTVTRLAERLFPQDTPSGVLDPEDILATFGISRTPQPLMISGPISISGTRLPPLSFFGVPPEQGGEVSIAGPVDHVLTIENYTSFIRHVREMNTARSALIIYTGGFPARSHLREIVRLAAEAKAPAFHWGDLDAGGVRIFAYLERALGLRGIPLRPHLMDASILSAHGVIAARQLRASDAPAAESAIAELWLALETSGLVLEQETLAPRRPGIG